MAERQLPGEYRYGFRDPEKYVFKSGKGLNREVVEAISAFKKEPDWMREFRLGALQTFERLPMPTWGADLSAVDFDDYHYYVRPTDRAGKTWEDVPDTIRDTFEKLGIPKWEREYLAGVSTQYECLTGDTLIMANPAAVPIRDAEAGMHVYALDEETRRLVKRKVLAVACKGERPVFEVSAGGRRIKCTENHPLLALTYTIEAGRRRGRFGTRWMYLKDLKPGDYVAVVKELPEEGTPYRLPRVSLESRYMGRNQLGAFEVATDRLMTRKQPDLRMPEETTDELMWFLGLYIGDGYLHRESAKASEKGIVVLAIPDSEPEMRERLRAAVEAAFGYKMSSGKARYVVNIRSLPIARLLTELGFDAHAKTKRLPKWLFGLPRSQRLAFIGGYIDSDGFLRNSDKNCDAIITSVNETLLKEVQLLAISCGLQAAGPYAFTSKSEYKGIPAERKAYRLILTGDLAPLLPHSLKVSRGYTPRAYHHRFNSAHGSPLDAHTSRWMGFARIRSIKPAGVEPVYDIEVEGARNFVAQGILVHNSEVVYHSIRKDLEAQGVLFTDTDSALREHPEILREYFGTVVPPADNKFAALNSAVWSGGSFIWVPAGVKVEIPLQAYFRINAKNMGQFERTLIVCEPGSSVHYVEGCSAPIYSSDSLHSAVVEIVVKAGATCRYTTIQNWSSNVYNLVTKRAVAYENASMIWVDGNIGSRTTMKYPAVFMRGRGARADIVSIAVAGRGQHQDAGAKVVHLAPETTSRIISKSISREGGVTTYRGLVHVSPAAAGARANVKCDALILDPDSRSDTLPYMEVQGEEVAVEHEATASKVSEEQLFYLMSRGLSEQQATSLIVMGFIEPFTRELPMEYAVELNRLLKLEMEGAVG